MLIYLLIKILTILEATLPGIAGIILTVGMAVYYKCINHPSGVKEELKREKSIIHAFDQATKAKLTVLDANVTLLAAMILFFLVQDL